jgi:hypothetical protein
MQLKHIWTAKPIKQSIKFGKINAVLNNLLVPVPELMLSCLKRMCYSHSYSFSECIANFNQVYFCAAFILGLYPVTRWLHIGMKGVDIFKPFKQLFQKHIVKPLLFHGILLFMYSTDCVWNKSFCVQNK